MVVIRLSRGGAKKRPFYSIVVAEKTAPRDGRFIERIGFANSVAAGKSPPARLDKERFQYWLSKGAQPTLAVKRFARIAPDAAKSPEKFAAKPAAAEASNDAPPAENKPASAAAPTEDKPAPDAAPAISDGA